MKKFLSTFIWCTFFVYPTLSQTWLNPHKSINLPNVPAESKLSELFSANGGNSIGNNQLPNAGTIKTMRNFHLMENDYKYNYFPKDGILNPDTCDCSNVWCNQGDCNNIMQPGTKSGFESSKGYYCAWKTPAFGFTEMYAALESIFPKYAPGGCANTTIARSYPQKWYTLSEFGGLTNAAQNFKNYVSSFLKTNCPKELNKPALVTVLEIGNEPWADLYPGKDGYHQLLIGAVAACREYYGTNNPNNWRIELSLAAFRAHNSGPGPFGEQFYYVEDAIPDSLKNYFNYVPIHPYAFNISNFNAGNISDGVSETPESDNGAFLTVKNMIEWKNQKMPHAKVNITEFGWDAEIPSSCSNGAAAIGESSQAAYTMRAFMLSARYNVHRAFIYGFTDQSECPLYYTTGLFKDIYNNVQRKSYKCIQTVVNSSIKDARFLKAISENVSQSTNGEEGKFVYIYGDAAGNPTHIVTWKPAKLGYEDNNYPTVSPTYDTIILPNANNGSMIVNANDPYSYMGWDTSQNGVIGSPSGNVIVNSTYPNILYVKLSGMPMVIPIHSNGCKYNNLGVLSGCLPMPTSPTGINNTMPENIVNMYHSSENGMIYINTGNYRGNVIIKIYDMMGRTVHTSSYLADGAYSFDFKGTSLGVYVVETMLGDGTVATKKIVTK